MSIHQTAADGNDLGRDAARFDGGVIGLGPGLQSSRFRVNQWDIGINAPAAKRDRCVWRSIPSTF